MKAGIFQLDHVVGDVYFFNAKYKLAVPKQIIRIGGPNEADIRADSGVGKLLMHFLNNLGQFYDTQTLSEATGLKPISISSYVLGLGSKFVYSKYYQMFLREETDNKFYGLFERGKNLVGVPVGEKKRSRRSVRDITEFL